ncbi:MAG: FAD-dependent oxidoreductase [Limnochordia bacterium]
MTLKYRHLFSPGRIGSLEVRNRLVMPPMATNFGGENGEVTERMVRYYAERAKGGVGVIIVENAQVDYPGGKNVVLQHRIDDDKFIPGLRWLARSIQDHGARVFQQIQHAGRQTAPGTTEGAPVLSPSPVPCGFMQSQPMEMTNDEIEAMIDKFAQAARRAKQAGFDGIEIHGAHGYLINQFLSPYSNRRNDKWGGSFQNRLRFALEIIRRCREAVGPDYPMGFRISADEFVPGGYRLEEGVEIAKAVAAAGVDILHVASGIYEAISTIIESMAYEEGWRVYLAQRVKEEVSIPVIAVGVIRTPQMADEIIAQKKADFVAIGRGLISDPEFALKAAQGQEEHINRCIVCNIGCVGDGIFNANFMGCTVNPAVGRERDFGTIYPTMNRKKVVVVGGGPAGMEAARVAKLRGHEVVLLEKTERLGGQMILAALPPYKDKVAWFTEFLSRELERLQIETRLKTQGTPENILAENPDAVVVATGALPSQGSLNCEQGRCILQAWDVIAGTVQVTGQQVTIVGGGSVGLETAEMLAQDGISSVVVEMGPDVGLDLEPITRVDQLARLAELDIQLVPNILITEITPTEVRGWDGNRRRVSFPGETVILALGSQPIRDLVAPLAGKVSELYLIGDARQPRRILEAAYEGMAAAYSIGEGHKYFSPLMPFEGKV